MAADRPGPRLVDDAGPGPPRDDDDDVDRRRLIKYVLVIAFAVPLVVEGVTLVGLVGSYVGEDATATPSSTATPAEAITEGSQLLPETGRDERVTTVGLQSSGDGWTLTLSVRVENSGDLAYELRLGAVTTDGDRRAEGSATTGRIAPGGTGTVSTQWTLPEGDRPDTVAVTAVEFDDGDRVVVDRGVRVGRVPVEG